MIVSVSRRTDIPAFYSEWFFNRINEGFVLVRNPMNPHQVSRIQLTPDVVDCFVFWTKDPGKMLSQLHLLEKYHYYFHVTITPYGSDIERNVPIRDQVIDSFRKLSETIGKQKVIFRYDPILLTDSFTFEYHLSQFEHIAQKLAGYTDLCIISFIDDYMKIRKNMKSINQIEMDEKTMFDMSKELVRIAGEYGMNMKTCSEKIDLSSIGIEHASCIDDKLIFAIIGQSVKAEKDRNQREACGCVTSIDIGSYNTCSHGCIYCYANDSEALLMKKTSNHDVNSPFLVGNLEQEDKVTERKMESLIDRQLCFIKKDSLR